MSRCLRTLYPVAFGFSYLLPGLVGLAFLQSCLAAQCKGEGRVLQPVPVNVIVKVEGNDNYQNCISGFVFHHSEAKLSIVLVTHKLECPGRIAFNKLQLGLFRGLKGAHVSQRYIPNPDETLPEGSVNRKELLANCLISVENTHLTDSCMLNLEGQEEFVEALLEHVNANSRALPHQDHEMPEITLEVTVAFGHVKAGPTQE